MKKLYISLLVCSTIAFGFDLGSFAKSVTENLNTQPTTSTKTTQTQGTLNNDTISKGLKEALQKGVTYATKSLGKPDGYLSNALVKIPLPENLQTAQTLIRKAGGDKIADDLIKSMNDAASKAAPKTADIFFNAIKKIDLKDAQTILQGEKDAATKYFQTHTNTDLQKLISPIVQTTMQENSVIKYYDTFNSYYQQYGKNYVQNNQILSLAKQFGADAYIPDMSEKNLNEYVTQKAIDGLFVMIAQQETKIRQNPLEQTTSLLKTVFGK
ncbi:MAG: DUF4197 domain-containing protein [Sulfurospirillum sp.]|nr:DUF4197 domain-containing protein [Sulfurospirillum sp.]